MNVARIISQTVKALPKTKGFSMPMMTIEGESLKTAAQLLRVPEETAAVLTKGMTTPKIDIMLRNSAKAKTNYAIAGLRVRDGEEVLYKGALSVTNPGARDSVVKLRLTGNDGQHVKCFFDSGKLIDTNDIFASLGRRKGIISSEAQVGEAYGHNIRLSEDRLSDLAARFGREDLLQRYNQFNTDLRLGALDGAIKIRKILQGNYEPMWKFEKVADTTEIAKVTEKLANTEKIFKGFDKNLIKEFSKANKKISMEELLKKYPELKSCKITDPKCVKDIFDKLG